MPFEFFQIVPYSNAETMPNKGLLYDGNYKCYITVKMDMFNMIEAEGYPVVHGLLSASQFLLTNQTYDLEYYFFIGFPPE